MMLHQLSIDMVRDLMCFEDPSLTPEQAASILKERFPQYSYDALLKGTQLVEQVRQIVKEENRQ